VEFARAADHRHRAHADAADLTTGELVASIVRDNLSRADHVAIAAAIDGAGQSRAIRVTDPFRVLTELSAAAAGFLAALLELSRRAALGPPPRELRRPEDVGLIALRELGGRPQETVLAIACDAALRVLRTVVVSRGTADRAAVPVREILSAILQFDGRAFAVAHNHPGGVLEPTDADIVASERIAAGARAVGLRFLGHVIVGEDTSYVAVPNSRLRAD